MPITSKKVQAGLWPDQAKLGTNHDTALTANNTTQGTATLLSDEYNEFGTVASSGAAVLPNENQIGLRAGDAVVVVNNGANALVVFPPIGGYIGAAAQNASVSVAAGASAIFYRTLTALKWAQK